MKRPTWKLLIAVAIILLAALTTVEISRRKAVRNYADAILKEADKASYWKTKSNKYAADVAALQSRLIASSKVKAIAKEASVPLRKVKALTTIKTEQQRVIIAPSVDTLIVEPDIGYYTVSDTTQLIRISSPATTGKIFHYKDDWIDIEARSGVLGLEIDYQVKDSISVIEYKDKGRKRYRAISHAPNTRITGLENISLEKKSRFVFGPFVGAAIDANTLKVAPVIGIGVGFTLFKI